MKEYIELLIEINRFCESHNALKIVQRNDGFSLAMQSWYNPVKTGKEIHNETLVQEREIRLIPNLEKYFTVEVSCQCIYLTSTAEE